MRDRRVDITCSEAEEDETSKLFVEESSSKNGWYFLTQSDKDDEITIYRDEIRRLAELVGFKVTE